MHQLLYLSTATEHIQDPVELNELAENAIQHNKESDVSGLLLYSGGYFMQLLEGPKQAVRETFSRIENDDRHSDIEMLFDRDAPARLFPDWAMCSNTLVIGGRTAKLDAVIAMLLLGVHANRIATPAQAIEYFLAPRFLR